MTYRGLEPESTRAVVQGFGSMGGATARYLARAGVKVVGIADREGLVYNSAGLDVETLLLTRDAYGVIDRSQLRDTDELRDGADWLAQDAEVLIPAAMSYVITPDNVDRIRATVIAEAANVATLKEAEESLYRRGVTVVPDFVANVGTNAWWWWVVFGDIEPTAEASFAKLSNVLGPLTTQVLERAAADGVQPREAATRISDEKRAIADSMYPRTIRHEAFEG
jgi:glutamate dehydrogenase (NAD(P)+)